MTVTPEQMIQEESFQVCMKACQRRLKKASMRIQGDYFKGETCSLCFKYINGDTNRRTLLTDVGHLIA